MVKSEAHIVVIGGGTGSYTLLQALKTRPARITALVNMADDGGSTGVLRDELGVLPPGDIRQCLVALSEAPSELRQLFNFRFPQGTFKGHSFGNLFLSAVESMSHDFNEAVRLAGQVLRIRGQVLPITLDNCELVCRLGDRTITGERQIANAAFPAGTRPQLSFRRPPRINPDAAAAIAAADLIVIAPGNLYGSLAPALLVKGVAESLAAARAPVVYVCNLVNKPRQTAGFAVHDYVSEIERFMAPARLDCVLYNTDMPDHTLLERYAVEQEYPVAVKRSELAQAGYRTVAGAFLSHEEQQADMHDTFIKRSLIRHDSQAIADELMKLL